MALKGGVGSLVKGIGKAVSGGIGALGRAFDPSTYSGLPQIIKGAAPSALKYLAGATPQGVARDIGTAIGYGAGKLASLPTGAGSLLGRATAGAVRSTLAPTLGAKPSPYTAERGVGPAQGWMGLPPSQGFGDFGGDGMIGGGSAGGGFAGPSADLWAWQQERIRQAEFEKRQAEAAGQGSLALQNLVNQYNKAFQEARSANEARYQQLLDIASRTTGQREIDIRQDYGGMGADISQRLARLGMANTTIAPTMQMGVQREMQSALNRLADEMQQTKLGIIERREDIYPRSDIIMQLAQMLGANPMGTGAMYSALGKMKL